MPVPRILSAAAVILTALVLALITMVAASVQPPLMPRPAPAPAHFAPGMPIDDPGPEPPLKGDEPCLPLTARNPDGNYIVPGVRGAIVYRRIGSGSGSGATEL